ncbi:Frataxin, partial [Nadsonia fulvescens var. elongata DSM 6958]
IDSVTIDEFHQKSDFALENMLDSFEELSEIFPEIDPELSQGVFTLELPPNGIYVINKQPPNKQIWMSSPISGPMRYDLVGNKWVSLRDGSSLEDTLMNEARDATG